MDTREQLKLRQDVPNEDIDDIIGRAAELHERARAQSEGRASVEEIEAVAVELDIPAEYVEAAIRDLKEEHLRVAQEQAAAKAAFSARCKLVTRLVVSAGLALALLAGGMGMTGSQALTHAEEQARLTEVALVEVIHRQADLAPQLIALAGGKATSLTEHVDAVRAATTLEDRLAASRDLGQAMAEAMGALPEPSGELAQQQRLELHHEVLGSRNRIDTESRRHAEAVAAFEQTQARPDAWVAQTFCWHQRIDGI